jgi:hypothetical protein
MRRDADRLFDEDNFQIIIDTFNDSRNGYMFVTTPLGAKLEQQISEEGEGNTRAGLLNANVNRNWDGIWEVAARITDDGWTDAGAGLNAERLRSRGRTERRPARAPDARHNLSELRRRPTRADARSPPITVCTLSRAR